MNIFEKRELWKDFRFAFRNLDTYLRGAEFKFNTEVAELAHVISLLNVILKRYGTILSEEEKSIIKERIAAGISRLIMLNQGYILSLYYFSRNYPDGPDAAITRAQTFISALRPLFELAADSVPIDGTDWKYFVRDLENFTRGLKTIAKKSEEPQKGRLIFLLVSVIHSAGSLCKSLENVKKYKVQELLNKAKNSCKIASDCLLELKNSGNLDYYLSNSAGLVLYLCRVLSEEFPVFNKALFTPLKEQVDKIKTHIDYAKLHERTKSFEVY